MLRLARSSKVVVSRVVADEAIMPSSPPVKRRKRLDVSYDNSNDVKIEETRNESKFTAKMEAMFNGILEMRLNRNAIVDQYGTEQIADKTAPPKVFRYQTLIGVMLSSQTKDPVTFSCMQRLRSHGCTPQNIVSTPSDVLEKLIYPVSFYRNKAKFIKETSQILLDQYDGDIPKSIEEIVKLPGVGYKMGHIALSVSYGVVTGIPVDTHVHRVSNRLGWVKTKTPEKTMEELESLLPRKLWKDFNLTIVGFGQQVCDAKNPHCTECTINEICPKIGTRSTK